jgi:hypothetical protein
VEGSNAAAPPPRPTRHYVRLASSTPARGTPKNPKKWPHGYTKAQKIGHLAEGTNLSTR